MNLTFTDWLLKQCTRDDEIGDLANAARDDQFFPLEGRLREYQRYMKDKSYSPQKLLSLFDAWHEWTDLVDQENQSVQTQPNSDRT